MSRLAVRALCIAISGLVLSWLLLADKSPLSNWLAGQPHVTNVVSAINLPTGSSRLLVFRACDRHLMLAWRFSPYSSRSYTAL